MDDWMKKALKTGLVGAGTGAAASLVLNALYHSRNKRRPASELIPQSVIERPYYIDENQAAELEAKGIPVRRGINQMKIADTSVYDIVKRAAAKLPEHKRPKIAFMDSVGRGARDVALPILTGLAGGYAGFKGVDYLIDNMAKETAKERYERKRKELQELIAQANPSVAKVAADNVSNGTLAVEVPALVKAASGSWTQGLYDKATGWMDDAGEAWGGYGIALPLALASMVAVPKAVSAFRKDNPNAKKIVDIENYYRDLPEHPRIKLVPTVRRPDVKKPADEEEEIQKVAASADPQTSSTVNPDLSPKVDTPKPSLARPANQFNGRFSMSSNMGFTRKTPGNMPMPKNPAARTPQTMGSIGTALG